MLPPPFTHKDIYMLECLRYYCNIGYPLFPCHSHGAKAKAPLTAHGFKDASIDWQQVEAWHRQYPECAWGCATSSERAVLDIDPRHGGNESLAKRVAEHGPLPLTPKVRTGGDGFHYYLLTPPGTNCGKVADGIEWKAEGGYVIVPPSRINIPEHEGRAYAWEIRPWEAPIAETPAWLLGKKPKPKASADADSPWVVREALADLLSHPGSPEGERHKTLCQLVGIHLARGDSESTVYALAEAWAERCQPPFGEWRKHVEGLWAKDGAKGLTTQSTTHRPVSITLVADGDSLTPELRKELINSFPEASAGANGKGELFPSFPPSAKTEHGVENELSTEWPTLPPEAYHGLFGEMLSAVSPETEADPAGVLLGMLTCFGNIVGRGAWETVGPRLHHPALYVGIVGRSSDAKGDGWSVSLWPFREVEPAWASACIANGVGSGEGLIERVADAQQVLDKEGKVQVIPGAIDKRCLLRLSELSRCFKLGRRENATLSEHLREGWDGEPIHVPNRKGNGLSASGYAIGMVGDITPGMLRKLMEGGTEAFDGWANRFLWACVKRSRFLPNGGNIGVLKPFKERLKTALAFAKKVGEVKRDAEADALWTEVYPSLTTSGDSVPHTDRARPYALRLAMLYALADGSAIIRREHLQASLALWEYCRQSARLIFGGTLHAEPDPPWLRLLNAIAKCPGVKRGDLTVALKHKAKAHELDEALLALEVQGLAHRRTVQGGGRPAECWYPGMKPEGDGEGESGTVDNLFSSLEVENPSPTGGRKVSKSDTDTPGIGEKDLLTFLPPPQEAEPTGGQLLTFLPPTTGGRKVSKSDTDTPGIGEKDLLTFLPPTVEQEQETTEREMIVNQNPSAFAQRRREQEHQQWLASYEAAQAKRKAEERERMGPNFADCADPVAAFKAWFEARQLAEPAPSASARQAEFDFFSQFL